MLSLYNALISQHARQLTPVRCAEQTIVQLHRYFEEVVLENGLSALVVVGLPFAADRSMCEIARMRELVDTAREVFLFVRPDDRFSNCSLSARNRSPKLIEYQNSERGAIPVEERFIVVADSRFSAVLATVQTPRADESDAGDDVIWSFEPDVVYSALEYLMARLSAEHPAQTNALAHAVRRNMPKTTSLALSLSVTTKLARLMQEQAMREVAVNRIATALRSTLDLPSILQTTVTEVGRALGARCTALHIEPEGDAAPLNYCYFRPGAESDIEREELLSDLIGYSVRFVRRMMNPIVVDGSEATTEEGGTNPLIAVPLIFHEKVMGGLIIRADDRQRIWQDNEVLLMQTVADQVAIAVNHARLYARMERLALTDPLTGCVNRRAFEAQIEKDMHLAMRLRQTFSLVILDIDHFKLVNDTFGHDAGDAVLKHLAQIVREELRSEDTAARLGGEEFALILPQADAATAAAVAERLRRRIELTEAPCGVGHITSSFGVASFPQHAADCERLLTIADRALYNAKRDGRNCVRVASVSSDQLNAEIASDEDRFERISSMPSVATITGEVAEPEDAHIEMNDETLTETDDSRLRTADEATASLIVTTTEANAAPVLQVNDLIL